MSKSGSQANELALRDREAAPGVVAGEDVGVGRPEHLLADRSRDRLAYLLGRGPEVCEEHVFAVGAHSDRLGHEIEIHAAGERVGDHERRRGEVVRLHLRVDSGLEVAVAGEHRADDQVALATAP